MTPFSIQAVTIHPHRISGGLTFWSACSQLRPGLLRLFEITNKFNPETNPNHHFSRLKNHQANTKLIRLISAKASCHDDNAYAVRTTARTAVSQNSRRRLKRMGAANSSLSISCDSYAGLGRETGTFE